ncbi:MAG: hypothetical protein QM737_12465 [Ferruginibacter sp.]
MKTACFFISLFIVFRLPVAAGLYENNSSTHFIFLPDTTNGEVKTITKADTTLTTLKDLPHKYLKKVDKKINKYNSQVSGKTKKTLAKLSRWENKIKQQLEKISPGATANLFAPGQPTFGSLLQKLEEGEAIEKNFTTTYDGYRDKLSTGLKYIASQKSVLDSSYIKPINETIVESDKLDQSIANSEATKKFIKERKKLLVEESLKYIGKSRYLSKISKESYYYTESLRNYKEIFSDPKKAEQTGLAILNKIPAYQKFLQENGMLASLFGKPSLDGLAQNIDGLQTRAGTKELIEQKIAGGGAGARDMMMENIGQAQTTLSQAKDRIAKAGKSSADDEIPDFKVNDQKSKTFLQRLEFGCNIQTTQKKGSIPGAANIALSAGFKLNDKSSIGIGASYKLGLGSIDRISITHQGAGLRSYAELKLKKQFYLAGGFEMNYNAGFKNIKELEAYNAWQSSGLIGISKKIPVKTKFTKGSSIQLLFDFLYRQHVPVSQPVVLRMGYNFK